MTYLLIGNNSLVLKELDDIKKNIENENIIKYDLLDSSIKDAIDDINTFNLFGGKKLIIVYNFDLLNDDDILINYLNNESENILVLITDKKLDERKKVIKELRNKAKVIDLSNIDLTSYINKSFKGYSIDNKTLNLLKDYCGNDYEKLKNEIDKLKMYKLDDKVILESDVKSLVKRSFDSNIFDLLNAISVGDKEKIFAIYYELLRNNEDEIKILGVLANHFRTLYKVKVLMKMGNDAYIMSNFDKMHPYRLTFIYFIF